MPSLPASRTYSTSVVTNVHLNIPACDLTTRQEAKEESKQNAEAGETLAEPLAKRSASTSSQEKALNDKLPTIATPIIMARPDGAREQASDTSLDEAAPWENPEEAPWSPSCTRSFEGIATVKPPLVMEFPALKPKSKSPAQQGAWVEETTGKENPVPGEAPSKGTLSTNDPVQETPNDRNEGA